MDLIFFLIENIFCSYFPRMATESISTVLLHYNKAQLLITWGGRRSGFPMTSDAKFQDLDLDIHWDLAFGGVPLEVFEQHQDVALGTCYGDGLGLNFVILVVSSNCDDAMIPHAGTWFSGDGGDKSTVGPDDLGFYSHLY